MDAPLLADATASFLLAFSALFSIVNPFGGALIYSRVTADRSHDERVLLAWRVALYSALVMLVALWAGAPILKFFGISIAALRLAGGLVVAARAWELLLGPEDHENRKQAQAQPAKTETDVAFFPLTLPFTTGPGTISVAIALGANGPPNGGALASFIIGASLAALVVALLVGVCYASADRIVALLGRSRARVVTRLAAFILLCVGVQILLLGAQDALRTALSVRV